MFKQKIRKNIIQLQFFEEANTMLLSQPLKCLLATVSVYVHMLS